MPRTCSQTDSVILSGQGKRCMGCPCFWAPCCMVSLWNRVPPSIWRAQATILDAVLPIWINPHMASSGIASSGIVTLILKKCTEETKPLPAAASRAAQRAELALDPAIVQQCVEMGFSEARVQEALRRVRSRYSAVRHAALVQGIGYSKSFHALSAETLGLLPPTGWRCQTALSMGPQTGTTLVLEEP